MRAMSCPCGVYAWRVKPACSNSTTDPATLPGAPALARAPCGRPTTLAHRNHPPHADAYGLARILCPPSTRRTHPYTAYGLSLMRNHRAVNQLVQSHVALRSTGRPGIHAGTLKRCRPACRACSRRRPRQWTGRAHHSRSTFPVLPTAVDPPPRMRRGQHRPRQAPPRPRLPRRHYRRPGAASGPPRAAAAGTPRTRSHSRAAGGR